MIKGFERVLIVLFLFLFLTPAIAQEDIKVRAGFTADSLRVGDEIFYYLVAEYPREKQILFPDTSYSFAPFEFIKKRYYITETKNNRSYDSAVYHLTTFEINKLQALRLPVFEVRAGDSTRYISNSDTVKLQELIRKLPDSITSNIPVKATIAHQKVPTQWNTPLIVILISLLSAIVVVGYFIFGDRIKQYFRMKKLNALHKQFTLSYSELVAKAKETYSSHTTESALVLWKKYMESLTSRPYTKLTTPETVQFEKEESLASYLRQVDAAIYGHETQVGESLEGLKAFADQRFNRLMQEVKNGK